ncbi:chaplin family protein [Streptomyces sp. NPDC056161]|uniref:chaplin family protein n=1 Tax=Streptomyces sp. NPDC056161 TaxID=3345732 RepID=UPI0035DCBCB6
MRQGTRKSLLTMAAATGALAAASGSAHADSSAHGAAAHSPGVLSGNTVQVPVHMPVNVCGNTVNVVGVLNPAMGNTCADRGGGATGGHGGSGGTHAGGHTEDSPGVGSGNTVQVPVDVPVNVCGNSVDVIGVGNAATGNHCANGGGTGGGHATPPGGGHGTPPEGGHETTPPGKPGQPGHPGTPGEPGTPGRPDTPGTPGHPGTPGTPGHPSTPSAPPATGGGTSVTGTSGTRPQGSFAQLANTGSDLPIGFALPMSAGALLAGTVLYRRARASA